MNVYGNIANIIKEENINNRKKEIEENRKRKEKEKEEQIIQDSIIKKKNDKQKCNEFVQNLTNYLLVETFQRVFDKAMKDNIFDKEDDDIKGLSRSLLVNYVNEETSSKILDRMDRGGLILTELSKNIKNTIKETKEKIDADDSTTLGANKYDLDNFFETLDATDFSTITNLIQTRVAQAAERFTEINYNDKIDLQDAANKTKDTITNLKKGIRQSDKDLEDMQESAQYIYKKEYNRIMNRKKTVYEQMIYTLSESVLHNEKLKDQYTTNNKIDFEKVEETVQCMYTFLEMVNTMKLQTVNESYIENVLKDLSK